MLRLLSFHAADELGAGGDIAPLVGTTHLETATLGAIEGQKIIGLEELIAELGERKAGFEAFLDRVLGHHIIHSDMLAYIADEIKEKIILHPVVVVDNFRAIGGIVEIEEFG